MLHNIKMPCRYLIRMLYTPVDNLLLPHETTDKPWTQTMSPIFAYTIPNDYPHAPNGYLFVHSNLSIKRSPFKLPVSRVPKIGQSFTVKKTSIKRQPLLSGPRPPSCCPDE